MAMDSSRDYNLPGDGTDAGVKDERTLVDRIVECRRLRLAKEGYSINEEDSYRSARVLLNPTRNQYQWDLVSRFANPKEGMSVLEIGSGHGAFIVLANRMGCDTVGIDADSDVLSVSREILEFYGVSPDRVSQAFGERLPFPDGEFDVVFSTSVLEHVQDIAAVIDESIRVTKPGGAIIHSFPNYRSFFEDHFKCLWLPFLGHRSGKWFVRLLDRLTGNPRHRISHDYECLDALNLTSLRTVRDTRKAHPGTEIESLGEQVWLERLEEFDFDAYWGMETLKQIVQFLHRIHATRLVGRLGIVLGFFTPIVMVLRKPRDQIPSESFEH
jgi:ubiquinone/menaquinone biosynthesis C-methylase UbiE